MTWLFIFILALSLYDWRTRRIPNWYTPPVILAGMIVDLAGSGDFQSVHLAEALQYRLKLMLTTM